VNVPRPPSAAAEDILGKLIALAGGGSPFVLVLLLRSDGSTPGWAGARALVTGDGRLLGTVGGGRLEAEAHQRALQALQQGRPEVFDFDLQGADVDGSEPICGGRARVLVDPTVRGYAEAYGAAVASRQARTAGVLLTTVGHSPATRVVARFVPKSALETAASRPEVEVIRTALAREEPVLVAWPAGPRGSSGEIFAEPIIPPPQLVMVGGGHVGQAVARQTALVGFDLLVLDDRPEFTRPELFPDGTMVRCGDIAQELSRMTMGAHTYVVIATRSHQHDAAALDACLDRPAAYLGMIGSRRKVGLLREEFLRSGRATPERFDRVHAPIGLDIGSVTPPEIAVSIVAELIAVRRKRLSPRATPAGS
jgi:xanthine dehydrogenase accessory factor